MCFQNTRMIPDILCGEFDAKMEIAIIYVTDKLKSIPLFLRNLNSAYIILRMSLILSLCVETPLCLRYH